jgi:hypothetical protein
MRQSRALISAVEDEVVRKCRPREQPGVAEQDVVQLVHHEHQQALGRGGVRVHELRIDKEARHRRALDCGGVNLGGFDDVQETEQCQEAVVPARECVQNAVGDRNGGHRLS